MTDAPDDAEPSGPDPATPDSAVALTEAEHAAMGGELFRIFGDDGPGPDILAAASVLRLLPRDNPRRLWALLTGVPSGSGWAGLRAAAEQDAQARASRQTPGAQDDAAI